MNIVVLNGSPRHNGNTHAVLQKMKQKLLEYHAVEVLDVCSMDLSGCRACDGCKQNGGHCICSDDSDAVIQKVSQADAVIFGTPVYWWGMSAQLKMVVDKFYAQDAQFQTMKKKVGVVAVGANELENAQYRLIREQFSCITDYLGWEFAFSLAYSAYDPGEICKDPNLDHTIQEALDHL